MSLYEGIKDVAKIIQKADNIELYQKLIELSSQALDMQLEIARLKEENAMLKKSADIEKKIIRHEQPFITIEGENEKIRYCANCWSKNKYLIQVRYFGDSKFKCPECSTQGDYTNVSRQSLRFL